MASPANEYFHAVSVRRTLPPGYQVLAHSPRLRYFDSGADRMRASMITLSRGLAAGARCPHATYEGVSMKAKTSFIGARALGRMLTLGIIGLVVSAANAQSNEARTLFSYDGLEEVKSKDLDMLFVQPGATLGPYKKVWLDPVEVAFHRSWNPDRRRVNAKERERIRGEIADKFQAIFTEELQQKGGYDVVSAAGPDVLRVSAAVINLYITAPDTMDAGRSQTYITSPGEMTLVAELRDSESGAILARVADRRVGRNTGMLYWATRVSNATEARRIMRIWADVLRRGLDSARQAET
jgi:hypothetical protein